MICDRELSGLIEYDSVKAPRLGLEPRVTGLTTDEAHKNAEVNHANCTNGDFFVLSVASIEAEYIPGQLTSVNRTEVPEEGKMPLICHRQLS